MKLRTYSQVWRALSADEKQDLAIRADTTYGYLKLIACKNGVCGRHLAEAITWALILMHKVQGDSKTLRETLFPALKFTRAAPANKAVLNPSESN